MNPAAIVAELLAHGIELQEKDGQITTTGDFDDLSESLKADVLGNHVALVLWIGEGVTI